MVATASTRVCSPTRTIDPPAHGVRCHGELKPFASFKRSIHDSSHGSRRVRARLADSDRDRERPQRACSVSAEGATDDCLPSGSRRPKRRRRALCRWAGNHVSRSHPPASATLAGSSVEPRLSLGIPSRVPPHATRPARRRPHRTPRPSQTRPGGRASGRAAQADPVALFNRQSSPRMRHILACIRRSRPRQHEHCHGRCTGVTWLHL